MEIIPAISSNNFIEIEQKITVLEGLTKWVQLDIADGNFAKDISWQTSEDLEDISGKIKIEAHLMIDTPEEVIPLWRRVVDRILVHVESSKNLGEIVGDWTPLGVELGLVLKLDTPISEFENYLDRVKTVQLMSISEIGHHGEPFAQEVLSRVEQLRKEFPNLRIQVDGGIDLEKAEELKQAGADAVVVGSAIWTSNDVAEAINKFKAI